MTTKPKEPQARTDARDDGVELERAGSIVLRLDALGLDFRAADFPTRFIEFCEANDDYDMEINEAGELVILPMVGLRGNRQETETNIELGLWQRANGGVNLSQTSRFRLDSGAIRGPDAAWITQERYDAITEHERETVFPGAPDFVVEIRSRTDNLAPLQRKMRLWMDGGVRLGWLIDPTNRRVYVYRAGKPEPEVLRTRRRWTARTFCRAFLSACGSTSSTWRSCQKQDFQDFKDGQDLRISRKSINLANPASDEIA